MAGIFGDYQFDPGSFSGILGSLLSPMMGQQLPAQVPSGFGPSAPAAAPQMPAIPPNAYAQAGPTPQQPIPQAAPQASGPGFGDRAMAALSNFANGGGVLPAIAGAITGATTGQRTDPVGLMLQQQGAIYQALRSANVPDPVARAAALDPEVRKTVAQQLYQKPQFEKLKGMLGEDVPAVYNPNTQRLDYLNGGGGGNGGPLGPTLLAPGVQQYNPSLPADQYLSQFSPDMQAVIHAQLHGDIMPTGNPRIQGMWNAGKQFAQVYAQKAGIPYSDNIYNAKRKMWTDLAASGNSSMGGILANGESSFQHLAEAGNSLAAVGNTSYNFPGGGALAQGQNFVTNALGSSKQQGTLGAARQNLLRYGQESTKFYAATGGGEGERLQAARDFNPRMASGEEMAAFLEKEKDLMTDRLRSKMDQVRQTLGDEDADRVIAQKMPTIQQSISKLDASIARLRGEPAPGAPQQQAGPQAQSAPRITTQADYAKLPKGSQYLAPDGTMRTKQ